MKRILQKTWREFAAILLLVGCLALSSWATDESGRDHYEIRVAGEYQPRVYVMDDWFCQREADLVRCWSYYGESPVAFVATDFQEVVK
jgi:hypothetical protein